MKDKGRASLENNHPQASRGEKALERTAAGMLGRIE
jgi:hypothetical protein